MKYEQEIAYRLDQAIAGVSELIALMDEDRKKFHKTVEKTPNLDDSWKHLVGIIVGVD